MNTVSIQKSGNRDETTGGLEVPCLDLAKLRDLLLRKLLARKAAPIYTWCLVNFLVRVRCTILNIRAL